MKRFVILTLCVVLTVMSYSVCADSRFIVKGINTDSGSQVAEFYDKILNYVVDNYKFDITKEELLQSAVKKVLNDHPELLAEFGKGAFEALDRNSNYYTFDEYIETYSIVNNMYVGIGVVVTFSNNKLILGEPIEGSPAKAAGLKEGDIIISIDGNSVEGMDNNEVAKLIRGEDGTIVEVTVLRGTQQLTYSITRRPIELDTVSYEILEDANAGYVEISQFSSNTSKEFKNAMDYFTENGISKVILDLRGNGGGYLSEAVSVASYFIPNGKLVVTEEYKDSSKNIKHYAEKTDKKFKAIVLIDDDSASASEIVASALRDYKSGTLVGRNSYGKGTVQKATATKSTDVLWMTIAEYYTPSHTQIHEKGLKPDYYVPNRKEQFDMSTVTPYTVEKVLKIGDVGDDVYAVKERLYELGYNVEVNNEFDQKTADAVESFQNSLDLYPYGEADITTQIKINEMLKNSYVLVDKQFEKALELVKKLK